MRADGGAHMSLLSTVYSQSWPAPDPVRGPRKGFFGKRPREATENKGERPKSAAPFLQIQGRTINSQKTNKPFRSKSAIGVRTQHGGGDAAPTPTSLNGQLGLDKGTLHWKSWSSYKLDCEQEPDDLSLYRLTTDTFRRLSQQVKDVNQHLSGKYHNSGFKSYYIVDDKNVPALRRSQLAASLPSQPPSICSPTPNESVSFKPSEDLQCTTVRGTPRTKRRPQSSFVRSTRAKAKHPPRSKSSLATILGNDDDSSSSDTKADETKDNFDQITPKVIEKLGDGKDKEFTDSHPGPFDIVKDVEKPKAESDEEEEESSNDEEDNADDERDEVNNVKSKPRKKQETDHSEDEASDDQRQFRSREAPNFDLSPEDLDVDDFHGKFGYHTSNMPKKKQRSHPEPLRSPWCRMDLLGLSELKNWRREIKMVPEGVEEHVMDRMIEMEKLQADTAHWERCQGKGSSRPPSSLQVRKGWNADAAIPTERAQSALSKPKQSKNCHEECTLLACAGECRSKESNRGCPYCKQLYCQGACAEYEYHLYVRSTRVEEDGLPTRPKSCRSCRSGSSSKNSVKSTINANTVVLGRPKSAFATFSSAKHQVSKPKAIGVSQTAGAEQVSNELSKLGLKAPTEKATNDGMVKDRPHTAKERQRPKGRDAILPGKSFQSQRRNSLTDEILSTSACSMNSRAMRARSARMRAQKRCKSAKK